MTAYARRQFAGGAVLTTVPLQIGSSDTSFTLATGGSTNWPDGSGGNFTVVVDAATPEKINCSARSGLVVTVASGGRGYDGTSAVQHPAGSAIQCVHIAQDDDEANQVVNQVLGQASAAKGDILAMLSAAGPNTLTRVPLGATGTIMQAQATGLPGFSATLLQLASSSLGNGTNNSTSYAVLNGASSTVTVTTGTKALVIVTGTLANGSTGGGAFLGFAISGATTLAASDASAVVNQVGPASQVSAGSVIVPVTLTAGSNVFTAQLRTLGVSLAAATNVLLTVIPMN